MKKAHKFKTLVMVLCLFICMESLIKFASVYGITDDVYQSRRVAEIDEFPMSYRAGLTRVKGIYPNAQFVYYDTGLDWYDDLLKHENELAYGRNLIPSNSPSAWKSRDSQSYNSETKIYNEVEPGWNQASKEVIAYYMDPRNFLDGTNVFQFVNLAYDESQTVEEVDKILEGTFMEGIVIEDNEGNGRTYAEAFVEIGQTTGVSPYLLACRVKQEQGDGNNAMIRGVYGNVVGYYNYFNIGAYGNTTDEILSNGIAYAKVNSWTTPYRSIYGGAKMLAKSYVDDDQNCLYLQHWNVVAVDNMVSYYPYMTNALAPFEEAKELSSAYTDKNINYTFIIPVYKNMPANPCDLPEGTETGAYLLKSLSLNDGDLDIGEFSSYTYQYKADCESELLYVILEATMSSDMSSIAINGIKVDNSGSAILKKAILLDSGINNITLTVTAENGLCRDYTIGVINDGRDKEEVNAASNPPTSSYDENPADVVRFQS